LPGGRQGVVLKELLAMTSLVRLLRLGFVVCLTITTLAVRAAAEKLPALPKGPLLLTSVTPEQLKPEFWTRRLLNADVPLKTPEELARFNKEIHAMVPERVNVFELPLARAGRPIQNQLQFEYDTVKGRILFGVNDKRIPKNVFEQNIKPVMALEKIPKQIKLKWGVAIQSTDVRALPSTVKMIEEVGDTEFDQLQFTLIKVWTPVAIFHASKDGKWLYVQAPYVRGWVRAIDIATFTNRSELKRWSDPDDFLVVTGAKVSVFLDKNFSQLYLEPSMGARLPLGGQSENSYVVWVPLRKADGKAVLRRSFVRRDSDVSVGFLPFTQRHIIEQAFKLLGARYGWGGMYKGRDCSGFTHDVYLSLGVDMPRDSKQQGFVGTQLGHFAPFQDEGAKLAALGAGAPGITLLRMPMHIMLYLGELDGKYYIIHSTWAERVSMSSDEKVRINQVVVSDLSMNGNSYLGSLFDRTVSINELN
jgi:hypothetical protein